MHAYLPAVFALGLLLAAPEIFAFCVYNQLKDGNVYATLAAAGAQRPPKIHAGSVAPGKESCCNPRTAECNPDRVPETDTATVSFEARIEAGPGGRPQMSCGKPTADRRRFPSGFEVSAPLRGSLLFEANPRFDTRSPAGASNPQFVLKALSPQKSLVTLYYCPPRG